MPTNQQYSHPPTSATKEVSNPYKTYQRITCANSVKTDPNFFLIVFFLSVYTQTNTSHPHTIHFATSHSSKRIAHTNTPTLFLTQNNRDPKVLRFKLFEYRNKICLLLCHLTKNVSCIMNVFPTLNFVPFPLSMLLRNGTLPLSDEVEWRHNQAEYLPNTWDGVTLALTSDPRIVSVVCNSHNIQISQSGVSSIERCQLIMFTVQEKTST